MGKINKLENECLINILYESYPCNKEDIFRIPINSKEDIIHIEEILKFLKEEVSGLGYYDEEDLSEELKNKVREDIIDNILSNLLTNDNDRSLYIKDFRLYYSLCN